MRFFYAIVIFVISLALFAGSIAIRYGFSAPDTLTQTITLDGTAPVTVIDAKELRRISGSETIVASVTEAQTDGAEATPVTMAWGRTPDVLAWVGSAPYQLLTVNATTGELTASPVSGLEPSVPSPVGSDLWLEEWSGDGTASADFSLRKGQSIIIATDGTLPAPASVTVIWKIAVDRTIPTVLLYLAAFTGFAGLIVFAWGVWRERRLRRHRQRPMPRVPKPRRWRPTRPVLGAGRPARRRGRRMTAVIAGFAVIPALLVGCTGAATVQPTPTPVAPEKLPFVAVSNQQFEKILTRIVGALEAADEKRAENVAATRLQGAALRFRTSTYRIKAANPKLGTLFEIPNGTVSLMLPQQTTGWPRSVFAIIDDTTNADASSVAIVLTQDGPRSNYLVDYTFALEPGVVMPEVPSADYGTAVLAGETELLSSTPSQVAEQYGDLLINGDQSPFASLFETDTLQEQIGATAKAKRVADMKGSMAFSWVDTLTDDAPIVFATTDAGALVGLTINEAETVKPARGSSAISTEGAVKILSGRPSSLRGIVANYQYQLLFYVPAIGSSEKLRLLGYSYALVSAKEVR
jgi:hypothetical protein